MRKPNQYAWLIVVEGRSDKKTYHELLTRNGVGENDFLIIPSRGKGNVCNAETWDKIYMRQTDLPSLISQDSGRIGFHGIILVVDSDSNSDKAFDDYKRSQKIRYVGATAPRKEYTEKFCRLDVIDGVTEMPIYGIAVPWSGSGSLETDLLHSYGFPIEGQEEYTWFEYIIQESSRRWKIPQHGDGKYWWEENKKAKLDKFMYSALARGFEVSGETPDLPNTPDVILNIKAAIDSTGESYAGNP